MDINDNAVSLLVGFIIPWNRSDPRRTQHRKSNATVTFCWECNGARLPLPSPSLITQQSWWSLFRSL